MKTLAVFCGASLGHSAVYAEQAEVLADALSDKNITLVYGGATVGLMGILANRLLNQGGKVIGVIPQSLVEVDIAHERLTELHIVHSMAERKQLIARLAEGFLMLPGGAGSLDEFFEMVVSAQLGHHQKPCGLLNTAGYYDLLLQFMDHAVAEGFFNSRCHQGILVGQSPLDLLNRFMHYQSSASPRWIKEPA
ncbi:TIGR00730 family Rossman fold protein [Legionella sp. MW5194]|uniref:LOG family protein n=1 Tax=Legionella sp. MW5194 TaxID=2662448 RepID=UPI00193CF19F|nr:TIGR00730 family Rossman fold protein [Legionella sp. MW5194]QRN03086.1 TIGR00730 family Rossman fold protein [Legionella sp. MW5194]